jgi:hypothetical protein
MKKDMRYLALAAILVGMSCTGGCAVLKVFRSNDQPYMTDARLERGLVMVFTGIEGRSSFNEGIADGLARGGVAYAIEIEDWTPSWSAIYNLEAEHRNRRTAAEYAHQIVRYRWSHPGRPVFLVGQSGGGAMAAWVAEVMHTEKVDGIIMIAAALSPDYHLEQALARSDRGIVNFYSQRDFLLLGTAVIRTMDGEFTTSAGRVGFKVPSRKPPGYNRLFQVPWNKQMAKGTGNTGRHLSSGAEEFVCRYIAPLVLASQWDQQSVSRVVTDGARTSNNKPQPQDDDLRARVR